jgi:hypothetical protein
MTSVLAVDGGDSFRTWKAQVNLLNKQLQMINNGSFYSMEVRHSPSTPHNDKKAIFIIT